MANADFKKNLEFENKEKDGSQTSQSRLDNLEDKAWLAWSSDRVLKARDWVQEHRSPLWKGAGISGLVGLIGYAGYYAYRRYKTPGFAAGVSSSNLSEGNQSEPMSESQRKDSTLAGQGSSHHH